MNNKKLKFIISAVSALAFACLFSEFSLYGAFAAAGMLFVALFCETVNRNTKEYKVIDYILSASLEIGALSAFVVRIYFFGETNSVANLFGEGGKPFLVMLAAVLAIIGYIAALNIVKVALTNIIPAVKELKAVFLNVVRNNKLLFPLTAFIFVLVYLYFIIHGNVNPDAYNEGYIVYWNAGWALILGRWAIGALNLLTNNIVVPQLNLFLLYVCSLIAGCIIIKLFDIKSKVFQIITVVSVFIAPSVILQCQYLYMEGAYALALLCSVSAAYLIVKDKMISGAMLLCVALGCYQAYIGFAAGLIYLFAIREIKDENSFSKWIIKFFKYLLSGVLGGILYICICLINLNMCNATFASYDGADKIGIKNSLSNIIYSIKSVYSWFFTFWLNGTFSAILFAALFAAIFIAIWLQKTSIKKKVFISLSLLLLPIILNCIIVIAPDSLIYLRMLHQCILLIPFLLSLVNEDVVSIFKLPVSKAVAVLCSLICFVFGIHSYCTQYSLDYAQKYGDFYATAVINQVLVDDTYHEGDRILFAGVLNEEKIHANNAVYKYSLYKDYSISWYAKDCLLNCWKNYINARLGFDTGTVSVEEYEKIIRSEEFLNMELYPDKSGIKKFGDIYVVKVQNTPPQ